MSPTFPLTVANTFIGRHGQQTGIQHLKLQKLVYYCHAWWLHSSDDPFLTQRPEVWQYGPVFSDLYRVLRGFGSQNIFDGKTYHPIGTPAVVHDKDIIQLVDWVWGHYGQYTAGQLSDRTHGQGTPWRILAEKHNYRVPKHLEIDDDTIKRCFRRKVSDVLADQ